MIDPESQKILIAGAGPSGAALAQVLRKADIPFELFEREVNLNDRRGGVFMIDSGLEALNPLLPDDMGDPRVASSNSGIGEIDQFSFVDATTNMVVVKHKEIPYGQPGFAICARRGDFRTWMCQHLPVRTSKRIARYEEDFDGVTVHFTDGTSTRGAMLVGADGASSAVRNQLLENPPKQLNPFVPIAGEVDLPRHAYLPLLQMGNAGAVIYSPNGVFSLIRYSVEPDGSSSRYWWAMMFRSEDPAADTAWVQAAAPLTLLKKALATSKDMPDMIKDVVRRTGEAGILQPQFKFTEWVPPKALPRGRVTLLGDAAHNTTPFGGQGANTALKDAADLGRLIVEHVQEHGSLRGRGDVDWILNRYEDIMLPRGRRLVLESRAQADENTGQKQSPKDDSAAEKVNKAHYMVPVNEPLMLDWVISPSPPAHD